MTQTRARMDGLYFLFLGAVLFLLAGLFAEHLGHGGMEDFKGVYYSTRCLLHHRDPYAPGKVLQQYLSDGGEDPSDRSLLGQRQAVTVTVYLPTTLLMTTPLAVLSWGPAHLLWMFVIAVGFILAAFLTWNLGSNSAPLLSGVLVSVLLVNAFGALFSGNAAGVVVSFCVTAVYCFMRNRFVLPGVLCLAFSLVVKPHDAGLVWLYFVLAGGVYRKRAMQTLVVAILLSAPAILWVSQVSPHWVQELKSNMAEVSGPEGRDNPGPATKGTRTVGMIVDIQSVFSVLRDDPAFYNSASYLICGGLILMWSAVTVKARSSQVTPWLALAAASAITMLPTYHRAYDAKLLLLSIPACAMLWAEGGILGWLAVVITGAGIVFTAEVPLAILIELTRNMQFSTASTAGKIQMIALDRPVPLVLLVLGSFYLCVYWRRVFATGNQERPAASPIIPLAK